jgi:hypothetical protein
MQPFRLTEWVRAPHVDTAIARQNRVL